jgi:hypothetical protein
MPLLKRVVPGERQNAQIRFQAVGLIARARNADRQKLVLRNRQTRVFRELCKLINSERCVRMIRKDGIVAVVAARIKDADQAR